METISFDKLLLKTAFCCMACDGKIDEREIDLIKNIVENSENLRGLNFQSEINHLIDEVNLKSNQFILEYLDQLKNFGFTEQQELEIIDISIKTINADENIEYTEIKFFKNIRHRLKIDNETILNVFPDIEYFLEDDISVDSSLDIITNQYLTSIELPKFELFNVISDKNIIERSEN